MKANFSSYAETISSLRWSYFKEQVRQSPILTMLSIALVLLAIMQSIFLITGAFSPLPTEVEVEVSKSIDKIKIGVVTALPIFYLFRQIFLTPFLIEKSNRGFFALFPIPNLFLVLTRWVEGGLAVTELLGTSFLFLIISFETKSIGATVCQSILWWAIIRATVATLYEAYCLVSDFIWLTIPLYILLYVWFMIDVLMPQVAESFPKMSDFWKWVDATAVQSASLGTFVLGFVIISAFMFSVLLYSYRMKNILLKK
jgi:hypothetical protein